MSTVDMFAPAGSRRHLAIQISGRLSSRPGTPTVPLLS